MFPSSTLQAGIFIHEVVSQSGRLGPDSPARRMDFICMFCTRYPLAFGELPSPLMQQIKFLQDAKADPCRGKTQVT